VADSLNLPRAPSRDEAPADAELPEANSASPWGEPLSEKFSETATPSPALLPGDEDGERLETAAAAA
jgi:hypothetical protein